MNFRSTLAFVVLFQFGCGGSPAGDDVAEDTDDTTGGECIAGNAGCPCYPNGTCDADLMCSDELVCVPEDCVDGELGCPCYPNATCLGDLVCDGGLCESPTGDGDTSGDGDDTSGDGDGDTSGDGDGDTTGDGDGDGDTTGDGDGDPGCFDTPSDMICIPAGTFEMGTDEPDIMGAPILEQEGPAHQVTITKSYWIDANEVTAGEYELCFGTNSCDGPTQTVTFGQPAKAQHPMTGATWAMAEQYCAWRGKRLPTEAEWEYAARGNDGRLFAWGDALPSCSHVPSAGCDEAQPGTAPVGTHPAGDSAFGVHDMGGGVWEWCSDYYQTGYYYISPEFDPQGPANGSARSFRSFSPYWGSPSFENRATLRLGWAAGFENLPGLGIRCAATPE